MSTRDAPLLVTGAAGFIGARFVDSCNRRGIPVISADEPRHFTERAEHRDVDFGRIVDWRELPSFLSGEKPALSGIVHLGACTSTTELDVDLLRRTNLEPSQLLWTWAASHRLPLVYASSAATYGDGALGYDDDEATIPRLVPLNPYGDSKQLFDLWALAEERRGHAPPSWSGFKFFNVYGYGERHKGPMASVILHAFDQIRSGGEVRLFRSERPDLADGEQKRDFVFVEDVVEALHFALRKPVRRGIFNLGSGTARTFLDLALATFRACDVEPNVRFIAMPPGLAERYQYFTEARMDRLRAHGLDHAFASLEEGVDRYVRRLRADF